jgi:hypothetical protein
MGATVKSPISFDWKDVTAESAPVTYSLQIASSHAFSPGSIIIEKTRLAKSEYTLTATEELKLPGSQLAYYWRIKAIDTASNESGWTGAGEFYVASHTALSTSVNPSGGGTVNRSPDKPYYDSGERVTLTATAASGYRFSHWSGDASGNQNPITITIDSNKSVVANFIRQYTLSTLINEPGKGVIIRSPDKLYYDAGERVTITADLATGYTFTQWSGDISGSQNPSPITMDRDRNVIANCYKEPAQEIVKKNVYPSFTLTKELKVGDIVEGGIKVDSMALLDSTWGYRILGPGVKPIDQWEGKVNYVEFRFTVEHSGIYSIEVKHHEAWWWNYTIRIWPPGWR